MDKFSGLKFDNGKPMMSMIPAYLWETILTFDMVINPVSRIVSNLLDYDGNEAVLESACRELMGLIDKNAYAALTEVASVFQFGMEKYGRNNWKNGIEEYRLLDAAIRHLMKLVIFEERDDESGLPHIAHAITNLSMIITFKHEGLYGTEDSASDDTDCYIDHDIDNPA